MTDDFFSPSPSSSPRYAAVARDAVVSASLEARPLLLSVSETAFGIDLYMIRCDACHRCFHGRCLCIPLSTALMLPSFLCPRCSPSQQAYTAALPALHHPTFLFPPLPARLPPSSSSSDVSALDRQGNNSLHRSILLMEDPPSVSPSSPHWPDMSASMAALAVVPNRDGYTAAHLAALLHMPGWLQFLLSISSDDGALLPLLSCRTAPSRTTVHTNIFLYELGGNTPLHLACYEGDEETVRVILAASSSPALHSLLSAHNDAALTPVDMLLLSPHVSEAKRQPLLDSLPLSMQQSAAPSSAQRLQLQARQRRRVDLLHALCRTYAWQGRATRQLALLFYAIEEEESKRRAESESEQAERRQGVGGEREGEEAKDADDDAEVMCSCGSDCRFRDASFGVMRFVLASRMQRTGETVSSDGEERES